MKVRRYLARLLRLPPAYLSIKIDDTIAFSGEVESYSIDTDMSGSTAKATITIKAIEIVKKLPKEEQQ